MPQFVGGSGSDVGQYLDNVQVRENLNETAFFYPALESDNNGNVAIRFTLPESVTTWKFMGLAHDKEMRNGLLVDEAVAQKTVMVQPNMPRFLREGDKSSIVVKLFNTSDKKVSGNARMQIWMLKPRRWFGRKRRTTASMLRGLLPFLSMFKV